jgi:UDP-N-acetylglucosamine/UDP-N-acetylgalactosamine diphosphorylase
MSTSESSRRVADLVARGVRILAPEQVYIDEAVDLGRIAAGATLYPGTRLHGARTYVGAGAHVGKEGPATLENAVLDDTAVVASGFVRDAVLLAGAGLGGNAHVREGTLLEEQASTGHAVGLKQSILLSFATLGSLINFCDATSRLLF